MTRVLILNASNEPLSVVTDRRAIVLLLRQKATVVVDRQMEWHSEHTAVVVPTVIRLLSYVRVPFRRSAPVTRQAVFGRDRHQCQYCSAPAESIDHIVPRSRGGRHTWENVVACCRRCNMRKANHLPSEAGFKLRREPKAPGSHGWIYARAGQPLDPSWDPYLRAG